MKIFIGWPYDSVWVEDYVIPLVESYGITVLTGKELQGKDIPQGVIENIAAADTHLFITTRRHGPDENGNYSTSDWVLDEMSRANDSGKQVIIEIREDKVEYRRSNLHPNRQHIPCDPSDRTKALVELGKALGQQGGLSLKLKISPVGDAPDKQAFIAALRQQTNYKCVYRIRQEGKVIYENRGPVEIVRQGQDYFIYTEEIPRKFFRLSEVYLEVEVNIGTSQWGAYGIRFNNPVEVPLETMDYVQKRTLSA